MLSETINDGFLDCLLQVNVYRAKRKKEKLIDPLQFTQRLNRNSLAIIDSNLNNKKFHNAILNFEFCFQENYFSFIQSDFNNYIWHCRLASICTIS